MPPDEIPPAPLPPSPVNIPSTGGFGDVMGQLIQGVDTALDNILVGPVRKAFGIAEGDPLDAELVQFVDEATDVLENGVILFIKSRQAKRAK